MTQMCSPRPDVPFSPCHRFSHPLLSLHVCQQTPHLPLDAYLIANSRLTWMKKNYSYCTPTYPKPSPSYNVALLSISQTRNLGLFHFSLFIPHFQTII